LSGIVAVGGVAALGAGLISSGGIGASWTDGHTATANISTASLSCALGSPTDRVQTSIESSTEGNATIDLDPITRSDSGTRTAPVTVTNTGDVPIQVTWQKEESGGLLTSQGIPFYSYTINGTMLTPGQAQNADIGFHWDSLPNDAEGLSATVTYKITCLETPTAPSGLTPFYRYGGSAYYDGTAIQLATGPNVPSNQVSTAGVYFDGVTAGSTLPDIEPNFTATGSVGTWPKMQIRLSDGTVLLKTAGASAWSASNAGIWFGQSGTTWANITTDLPAGVTVQRAYIQAQNPGFTGSITCINYANAVLGNC
jgi:hypothetical protein